MEHIMQFYNIYMVELLQQLDFSEQRELQPLKRINILLLFNCNQILGFSAIGTVLLGFCIVFKLIVRWHKIIINLQFLPQSRIHFFLLFIFHEVLRFAVWIQFRLWYLTDQLKLILCENAILTIWEQVLRQVNRIERALTQLFYFQIPSIQQFFLWLFWLVVPAAATTTKEIPL